MRILPLILLLTANQALAMDIPKTCQVHANHAEWWINAGKNKGGEIYFSAWKKFPKNFASRRDYIYKEFSVSSRNFNQMISDRLAEIDAMQDDEVVKNEIYIGTTYHRDAINYSLLHHDEDSQIQLRALYAKCVTDHNRWRDNYLMQQRQQQLQQQNSDFNNSLIEVGLELANRASGGANQQTHGYCAFDQFGNKIRCVSSLIECRQWITTGGQCAPQ